MREGAVGFRHPMHIFTLLDGVSPAIRRIEQLGREPLRHRFFIAFARRRNQPANPQRLPAHRAYFDRHLIGGAADAARTYFDRRHHVLERLLEDRQRALLGLGLDHAERAVDDAFGDRLLPGVHHRVHEFRNDDVSELRIRKHFTLFSRMAARHLLSSFVMAGLVPAIHVLTLSSGPALTWLSIFLRRGWIAGSSPAMTAATHFGRLAPYFERRCLRFLTPWVSR